MIRSIEGLRGVAALLVVFFHSYGNHWGGTVGQWGIVKHAFLFVDMFFVISGFVMTSVYGQSLRTGTQVRSYMVRRFFRLYPLHIVMTFAVPIVYTGVQFVKLVMLNMGHPLGSEVPFSRSVIDLKFLPLEIFLLNGFGLYWIEIGNFPSWSVSVEFWMYVSFALIFFKVRSVPVRVAISLFFVVSSMAWFWWMWNHGPWGEKHTLDEICLPRGFMSFFLGVIVAYLWERFKPWLGPRHRVLSATERHAGADAPAVATGGAAAGRAPAPVDADTRTGHAIPSMVLGLVQVMLVALVWWLVSIQPRLGDWQLVMPVVFGVLVLFLLPDRGAVADLLNTRPFQWLGRLSYSIYLVHVTVLTPLDMFGRVLPEPKKHIVGVVFIVGVFALATLTYRYIEVPWRARGKRIADRIEGRA